MTDDPEKPVTAAELAARARELATLPDIYARIKQILDDPTSSHGDVADALATDPALAARLLRVANSAFYGRPATISTISGAVGLLGTQHIHDLVLATAVIHAFDGFSSDLVDQRAFWTSSLFGAAAAKLMAEECGILDSERLFVAGLLAPVGLLILYQELPDQMRTIVRVADQQGQELAALERAQLGFDHARVGAELFSAWRLPPELVMPIGSHTRPSTAGNGRLEASILHIATQLATIRAEGKALKELVLRLPDDAWDATEMSMEKLQQIEKDARVLRDELLPVLLQSAA